MVFRTKFKGLLLFNCLVEEAERKCGISRNVSRKREWLTISPERQELENEH